MIRLLIGLLLLFSTNASALSPAILGGISGGGGACATDSVDVDATAGTFATWKAIVSDASGQSFQVATNGQISAISFYPEAGYNTGTITLRWGAAADLTTYEATETVGVTVAGENKVTFTTKGSAVTGTTYYFGISESAGDVRIKISDASQYANGSRWYSDGDPGGWVMDVQEADYDMKFKIYLCD